MHESLSGALVNFVRMVTVLRIIANRDIRAREYFTLDAPFVHVPSISALERVASFPYKRTNKIALIYSNITVSFP